MLRSTFYSFTTATRALAINQKSLDVVGQNIANMGTIGYTRQRVDRYSVSAGTSGLYGSATDRNIGQGVELAGIRQARDPYLDLRFRKEVPKIGELDGRLTVLKELESVFDETTMSGITSQMSDMIKQLQALSQKTGNPEFEGIVKTSAELLTRLFNQFSNKIDATRKEQENNLENVAIPAVNDILKNLKNINENIKNEQINGGPALELIDQRNVLLDELSQYMPIDIKISKKTFSPGVGYDEMTINIVGADGSSVNILDPKNANSLRAEKNADGKYVVSVVSPDGGTVTDVTDKLHTGNFKGYMDMLNYSGEFDSPGTSIKGVGYYEGMLDNLAGTFAEAFNGLNQSILDDDGNVLVKGGSLFETKDGTGKITAKNIKLAEGWVNNDYGIVAQTKEEAERPGDTSSANGNILKMIAAFTEKRDFNADVTNPDGTVTNKKLFTGTFQEMLSQTGTTLALEVKSSTTNLKNHIGVIDSISAMRDSISAVSLDEEGISLLQYQKAYNAAARLMTTLDEAIGTIINNMGVVGR